NRPSSLAPMAHANESSSKRIIGPITSPCLNCTRWGRRQVLKGEATRRMTTSPAKLDRRTEVRRGLTFARCGELLLDSAFRSAVTALVIVILGGIGIGLVRDLWSETLPSLPPIFSHTAPEPESTSSFWNLVRGSAVRHRFALVFTSVFVVKSAIRLAKCSTHRGSRRVAAFLLWRGRRFKDHWFTIIFINAFGAYF